MAAARLRRAYLIGEKPTNSLLTPPRACITLETQKWNHISIIRNYSMAVSPPQPKDPQPDAHRPAPISAARTGCTGPTSERCHRAQPAAVQPRSRTDQDGRAPLERLQHLRAVGQRRTQPGQLRVRPWVVRPRPRRLADRGVTRHRRRASVRAADGFRLHGLSHWGSFPGDEPHRFWSAGSTAARVDPRRRSDRVVRHPDLSGLAGAAGTADRPGTRTRPSGPQRDPRPVHPGLAHLRLPLAGADLAGAARDGHDPQVRGLRRADHPGHHGRTGRLDLHQGGRLDRLVAQQRTHRRRDVGADTRRQRAVGVDLRHLRPQFLRLHPRLQDAPLNRRR